MFKKIISLIIFIAFIGSNLGAVENQDINLYPSSNKLYQLDVRGSRTIDGVGSSKKIFQLDYSSPEKVKIHQKLNEQLTIKLSKEWETQFKQSFSLPERKYLKELYQSALIKKIETFNENFFSATEIEKFLKKSIPTTNGTVKNVSTPPQK